MPKFSVLIPTIKSKFLDSAIRSVLDQTFSDWELIIYDDFSPDDIAGVVSKYEDDRIYFSRGEENLGANDPSVVWNKMIKTAKGGYICLLGDDDVISVNYLEEINKLILKYPGVSVFRAKLKRIDEKDMVISEADDLPEFETWDQSFYARNVGKRMQSTSEFVLKKESLDKIGGYVNFPRACGSDDATYLVLSKDNGIVSTNNAYACWRKNSLNISDNDSQEVNEYKIKFLLKWEKDFLDKTFSSKVPLGDLYGSIDEFFVMQKIKSEKEQLRVELNGVVNELAEKNNEVMRLKKELRSLKRFFILVTRVKAGIWNVFHLSKMFFFVWKRDGLLVAMERVFSENKRFIYYAKRLDVFRFFANRKKKDIFDSKNGRRIFVDCTFAYKNPNINTGIQRVVRNIIKNAKLYPSEKEAQIIPIAMIDDYIIAVDPDNNGGKDKKRLLHGILSKYERYKNIVVVEKGDTFIMLDAIWIYDLWGKIKDIKDEGGVVIGVYYDLIPILFPHFFEDKLRNQFIDFVEKSIEYFDGYVAISRTVMDDLRMHIKSCEIDENDFLFDHFMLGADFKKKDYAISNIRKDILDLYKNEPVYLAVSTIEPRKNHTYMLDSFEILWAKGVDVKLCIIGKIGWKVDRLIERIKNHKEYNKRLFMFNDASDEELLFCYKHSKSLVFASFSEGFGLPIVESLNNGLPALVSDIPIHREVGGDNVIYFDLKKIDNLAEQISKNERENIFSDKKYNNIQAYSWQESSKEFFDKTISMSDKILKKKSLKI